MGVDEGWLVKATGATDAEVKFVGFSLIFHNTTLAPGAVVQKHFEKDVVKKVSVL